MAAVQKERRGSIWEQGDEKVDRENDQNDQVDVDPWCCFSEIMTILSFLFDSFLYDSMQINLVQVIKRLDIVR